MRRLNLEAIANIAIVFVSVLFVGVLAHKYFTVSKAYPTPIGEKATISDFDWEKNKYTVILALQKDCRLCSESAGFYRQLLSEISKLQKIAVIGVLPDPIDTSQEYLHQIGVRVDVIKRMPLSTLKVAGSPSILIVDKTGKIVNGWVGKLSPQEEQNVVATLNNL